MCSRSRAADDEEREALGIKRSRGEEDEATRAAYERIRAENEAVREKAAQSRTAEEIAAAFEAKEREIGYLDREEDEEEYGGREGLEAGAADSRRGEGDLRALPSMADPKLWMMACKEGEEAAILIAITNKYIARERAGQNLGIMSAVCTSKGRIFVECHREAIVKEAVKAIADLYSWKEVGGSDRGPVFVEGREDSQCIATSVNACSEITGSAAHTLCNMRPSALNIVA